VIDWAASRSTSRGRIAIVNSTYFPFIDTLIPRKLADAAGLAPFGLPPRSRPARPVPTVSKYSAAYPQSGTPFAVDTSPFVSFLNFPCHTAALGLSDGNRPRQPQGAVDAPVRHDPRLRAAWPQPADRHLQPWRIGHHRRRRDLHRRDDRRLFPRLETTTGRELWKADLPAGGQANPMSYVSKKTGRQYVVVAAAGIAR